MCDTDPHQLIAAYCDHLPVPAWVTDAYDFNADKTSNCFHCHVRFIPLIQVMRTSRHNCRLCGELVCRSCSSKLSIPKKFEKKDENEGGSRVCHQCFFLLLVKRALAGDMPPPVKLRIEKFVMGSSSKPTAEDGRALRPRSFSVPSWVHPQDSATCFKCNAHASKRHHCRLCGLLYCRDCSDKIPGVPQHYDQKNRANPNKRVCDFCRFNMLRVGWKCNGATATPAPAPAPAAAAASSSRPVARPASATPAPVTRSPPVAASSPSSAKSTSKPPAPSRAASHRALPPPPTTAASKSATSSSSSSSYRPLSQCSVSTCSSSVAPRSDDGYCSLHSSSNASLAKNSPAAFEVVLRFRWESDPANQPAAQLTIIGHADMHAIHTALMEMLPGLAAHVNTDLQYVLKGRAAMKMHWRMFEARFQTPEIILKKLSTKFDHKKVGYMKLSGAPTNTARSGAAPPTAPKSAAGTPPRPPPRAASSLSPPAPINTTRSNGASSHSPSSSPSSNPSPSRQELLASSKPSRAATSAPVGPATLARTRTTPNAHATSTSNTNGKPTSNHASTSRNGNGTVASRVKAFGR